MTIKQHLETSKSYIVCYICDKHFKCITHAHLKHHNMTLLEYKEQFPGAPTVCEKTRGKLIAAAKKINRTPEYWEKLSNGVKRFWATPAGHDKMTKSLIKSWDNEKRREATSDRMRNRTLETQERINVGLKKAHADPNSGFNSSECREKHRAAMNRLWADPEYHQMMSDNHKTVQYLSNRWDSYIGGLPTAPEAKIGELLDSMELPYKMEQWIVRYRVDFLIGTKFILEMFGDYWHGPDRPEQQIHDEKRLGWLEDQGYDTLVIWEHEINNEPERCKAMIENHIAEFGC